MQLNLRAKYYTQTGASSIKLSLFERKKGNGIYRYFKKGGSEQIYLGPVGKEDPAKVRDALNYLQSMREDFLLRSENLESQLAEFLPEEESLSNVNVKQSLADKERIEREASTSHEKKEALARLRKVVEEREELTGVIKRSK